MPTKVRPTVIPRPREKAEGDERGHGPRGSRPALAIAARSGHRSRDSPAVVTEPIRIAVVNGSCDAKQILVSRPWRQTESPEVSAARSFVFAIADSRRPRLHFRPFQARPYGGRLAPR